MSFSLNVPYDSCSIVFSTHLNASNAYALFQKGPNGQWVWVKKRNFRIWSEDELREKVKPEDVSIFFDK